MFNYDRLDELIAESGKTKKYLSQKMGHGPRYLNDAKKNNAKIKDSDLAILAEELNTTVAYLKGETNKKSPTLQAESEVDKEMFTLWKSASEEERRLVLRVLRAYREEGEINGNS